MLQHKWLARALVITGFIMVALLTIAINHGPLIEGFQPARGEANQYGLLCPWCDSETPPTFTNLLGTALILLLILCIPVGHVAVIILVVQQLNRVPASHPSAKFAACPYCEHPIHRGWKACPACGNQLGTPPSTAPPASSTTRTD